MVRIKRDPVSLEMQELLRGVDALPCEYSRRQMRRTLKQLAGKRLYISRRDLVAPDELALALTLIGQMRVSEASKALQIRLQCQKTKAYKLIAGALQARAGQIPAAHANAPGLRQLALALEDDGKD